MTSSSHVTGYRPFYYLDQSISWLLRLWAAGSHLHTYSKIIGVDFKNMTLVAMETTHAGDLAVA